MLRVILETEDVEALEVLKAHAREMQITVANADQGASGQEQALKAFTQANLAEIAGSLTDLDLDADELRKKAWNREKSKF